MDIKAVANTTDDSENIVTMSPLPVLVTQFVAQPRRGQPEPADLLKYGIKVRDFAYERTNLPPLRPVVLREQSTEPTLCPTTPEITRPRRNFLARKSAFKQDPEELPDSQRSDWSFQPFSQVSHPPDSQESEPWVDTPLATPNGSLQWIVKNAADDPNSQPPSQEAEMLSYEELGFAHPMELDDEDDIDEEMPMAPIAHEPPVLRSPRPKKKKRPTPPPVPIPALLESVGEPRYHFRNPRRPSPVASPPRATRAKSRSAQSSDTGPSVVTQPPRRSTRRSRLS